MKESGQGKERKRDIEEEIKGRENESRRELINPIYYFFFLRRG